MKNALDILNEYWQRTYGDPPVTEADDIYERLNEFEAILVDDEDRHRWWITMRKVIQVGDSFISYGDAQTTGDSSPREVGWEFDPESMEVVYPITRTVVDYVSKKI